MFFPPPLKSSAAIRAASTEPIPLVSWKMPEISLSTPTRTTLSEISARTGPHAAHDKASARHPLNPHIVSLPAFRRCPLGWGLRPALRENRAARQCVMAGPGPEKQTNRYGKGHAYKISKIKNPDST